MAYRDDDDKKKDDGAVSEEALGEVLEAETDEDEDVVAPDESLLDDEKAWE